MRHCQPENTQSKSQSTPAAVLFTGALEAMAGPRPPTTSVSHTALELQDVESKEQPEDRAALVFRNNRLLEQIEPDGEPPGFLQQFVNKYPKSTAAAATVGVVGSVGLALYSLIGNYFYARDNVPDQIGQSANCTIAGDSSTTMSSYDNGDAGYLPTNQNVGLISALVHYAQHAPAKFYEFVTNKNFVFNGSLTDEGWDHMQGWTNINGTEHHGHIYTTNVSRKYSIVDTNNCYFVKNEDGLNRTKMCPELFEF